MKIKWFDIFIIFLTMVSVAITILDYSEKIVMTPFLWGIELIIWLIFVLEFGIGYFKADSKGRYFREHIADFIAIIPINEVFRAFKFLRIVKFFKIIRMIRIFALIVKLGSKIRALLDTNHFIHTLYVSAAIVTFGAIGIYFTEKGLTVNSLEDAFWWSFVTTTTVGYGDISPTTGIGRLIAMILMLTGISTIGMLTSTLATYFLKNSKTEQTKPKNEISEDFDLIQKYNLLNENQRQAINNVVDSMLNSNK